MATPSIPLSAQRPRSAGGRGPRRPANTWIPRWSDELKGQTGDIVKIMLTPGSYPLGDLQVPYFSVPLYQLKYTDPDGREKYGYYRGQDAGECTLAARADEGDARVKAPKWGEPNRFFVNIIHFGVYYQKTALDPQGRPKLIPQGKNKGKPVQYWTESTNRNEKKKLLENLAGGSAEVALFRKRFFDLSYSGFKLIGEIDLKARSMCKCGGALFPQTYGCSACGKVLLDANDTDKNDAQILEFGGQEIRCRECAYVGYPVPAYACDTCDDPTPHEYHEVVATLVREMDNGFPRWRLDKVVPATEFELENRSSIVDDVKEEPGKPLVFSKEIADLRKIQYDFDAYTAPKTNAEYSTMLGLTQRDAGYAADSRKYSNNFR